MKYVLNQAANSPPSMPHKWDPRKRQGTRNIDSHSCSLAKGLLTHQFYYKFLPLRISLDLSSEVKQHEEMSFPWPEAGLKRVHGSTISTVPSGYNNFYFCYLQGREVPSHVV